MEDVESLYGELFDLFYNSKWADDKLAAFKMQVGDNYENGPLFIGRATNGWTPFCPNEWNRESFIQNPMLPDGDTEFSDWLANNGNTHYKISTSPFWQDAKRIFTGLYDGDFKTDIAYSNLCKIALSDANPIDEQCYLQLDVCREILLAEITELGPECIVFMTGYHGWAEWFFDDWDEVTVDDVSPDEVIKCSGEIAGCPFVVIHHPERTRNRGDTRDEAVKAVVEYFQGDDDDSYDDDEGDSYVEVNYELSSDVIQKLADIMCQYAPAMWSCITLEVYLDDGVFHFNCEALDTEDTLYDISIDDEDNECLQNTLLFPMSEQQLEFFRIEIDSDGDYSIEFI